MKHKKEHQDMVEKQKGRRKRGAGPPKALTGAKEGGGRGEERGDVER